MCTQKWNNYEIGKNHGDSQHDSKICGLCVEICEICNCHKKFTSDKAETISGHGPFSN